LSGPASDCDPPTYASCVGGITGMYHHTQPYHLVFWQSSLDSKIWKLSGGQESLFF
jgi:hypothetical protein